MGAFIEGGARWGYDAIWEDPDKIDDDEITKPNQLYAHSTQERQRWIEIKAHQGETRKQNEKKIVQAQVDAP